MRPQRHKELMRLRPLLAVPFILRYLVNNISKLLKHLFPIPLGFDISFRQSKSVHGK